MCSYLGNPTLRNKYYALLPTFLEAVPMDDQVFFTSLEASRMFPGNTRDHVAAKPTKAEKVKAFLDTYIKPAFSGDGKSNEPLRKLLIKMKNSGFPAAINLAKQFESESKLLLVHNNYFVCTYVCSYILRNVLVCVCNNSSLHA